MKMIVASFFLLFLFVSCEDSTSIETGTIYISVVDTGGGPVPNKEIIIMPDSLVKTTNVNGVCLFELKPGNYYVTAHLSRPGPADFFYNELVRIEKNKTLKIKLTTCPSCV